MRMSCRLSALLLLAIWPQAGCLQLPTLSMTQPQAPMAPEPHAGPTPQPLDPHLSARWEEAPVEVRAAALEKEGRAVEAIAAYEQMRQLGGEPALFATRRLVVLHDATNNVDRAAQEYQILLDHCKRHRIKDAELLYHAGDFYYRRGHWGTAELLLRDAVYYHESGQGKLSQANEPLAKIKLGMSLAHNGIRDAAAYAESLEVLTPVVGGEAEAYCRIAFVMNLQGKREDAARAYQQALARQPNNPTALAALAQMQVSATAQPGGTILPQVPQQIRGSVELEAGLFPPQAAEAGMNRFLSQRPTLPPLPEIDFASAPARESAPSAQKKGPH